MCLRTLLGVGMSVARALALLGGSERLFRGEAGRRAVPVEVHLGARARSRVIESCFPGPPRCARTLREPFAKGPEVARAGASMSAALRGTTNGAPARIFPAGVAICGVFEQGRVARRQLQVDGSGRLGGRSPAQLVVTEWGWHARATERS